LMLLLGVWSVHLYFRFSPVYEEIRCELRPPRLGRDSGLVAGQWKIQLITTTECHNPNPYSVVLQSAGDGQVYLGDAQSQVASITSIPKTTLPADGTGTIAAIIDIPVHLDLGGIFSGVGLLFGQQLPVYIRNKMELVVDVHFLFGGHFSLRREFDKDCGMNVQLHRFHPAVGPMACAEAFDRLPRPLPEATTGGGSAQDGELKLSAKGVAQEDIQRGERVKNVALRSAIAVTFSLAFFFSVAAACASGRGCRVMSRGLRCWPRATPLQRRRVQRGFSAATPSAPTPKELVGPTLLGSSLAAGVRGAQAKPQADVEANAAQEV